MSLFSRLWSRRSSEVKQLRAELALARLKLAQNYHRQWQEAMRRAFIMRAALVRAGVTDPEILGEEIFAIYMGNMVDLMFKCDANQIHELV